MRRTLGMIGAAILLTAVAGCNVTQNIVRIEVDFKGNPSCSAAGVDSVRVTFPDTLMVPRIVPCDSDEGIAVEFDDLDPATYRVFVDGMKNDNATWSDREEIVFTGGLQTFKFDLHTISPSVLASFKFAAPDDSAEGMTCAQAEVTSVQVAVDNGTPVSVNCHNPTTGSDVALLEVSEGSHDFRFFVADGQDRTLYEMTTKQTVKSDASNTYNINLVPKLQGSLQLQWTFSDAAKCSDAGVSKIYYELTKPDGSPGPMGTVDCADSNGANGNVTIGSETVGALPVGNYSVATMQGLNNAATPKVLYETEFPVGGVFVLPGRLKAYNVALTPL